MGVRKWRRKPRGPRTMEDNCGRDLGSPRTVIPEEEEEMPVLQ
jgi:hypothetical protein